MINFDDLECPYCARLHQELFPATIEHYKDLVRFVYKDDPLTDMHPWAMHAAVDANCLAAQSGPVYWTYVDYLHAHGQEMSGEERDPARAMLLWTASRGRRPRLANWTRPLDACIAKQDETQIKDSMNCRSLADRGNARGLRERRKGQRRRCACG